MGNMENVGNEGFHVLGNKTTTRTKGLADKVGNSQHNFASRLILLSPWLMLNLCHLQEVGVVIISYVWALGG
jgi:hypothetical protein